MRGVSGLLACAAAGFACQNVLLSFFLVFCAACVFDTKAKLFAQGGLLTCATSTFSQIYPKAFYISLPLGLCAFILPVVAKAPDNTVYKARASSPPILSKRSKSPTSSIADLL